MVSTDFAPERGDLVWLYFARSHLKSKATLSKCLCRREKGFMEPCCPIN